MISVTRREWPGAAGTHREDHSEAFSAAAVIAVTATSKHVCCHQGRVQIPLTCMACEGIPPEFAPGRFSIGLSLGQRENVRKESTMSSASVPKPHDSEPSSSPYCSDPNCKSCKELREMQEAIRLRAPIPESKKATAK